MLQAICCATVSETSERMCRRADKWKLQARTTVETCLLKLMVWSFKLSLTRTQLSATRRCVGYAAPERDVELSQWWWRLTCFHWVADDCAKTSAGDSWRSARAGTESLCQSSRRITAYHQRIHGAWRQVHQPRSQSARCRP